MLFIFQFHIYANQKEILCWYYYKKEFLIQISVIIQNSKSKIGKKKAKEIIYDKLLKHLSILHKKRSENMDLQLSEMSYKYLQGKIQKVVKIYNI